MYFLTMLWDVRCFNIPGSTFNASEDDVSAVSDVTRVGVGSTEVGEASDF